MSKFGLHMSSQAAINAGWVQKFSNSPVHLVLAVGIGGELPRTLQVADMCPNSLIVYRAWHYGIAQSDHFEQYYTKYGTDPMPLIDRYQSCFNALQGKNVTYQFWNETGFGDMWPHFVEFNTNLIHEMDRIGQSCCILGAGPGYPTGTRAEIFNTWQQARPMFEALNSATHQHYINLHEYFGYPVLNYSPFLFGRFEWMLEDLFTLGLLTDKIKVIIGESSWADPGALNLHEPPNPANGYRGYIMKGITPQQLADDLVNAYHIIYDPSPHLVGTCHYCLGDSGGWAEFDLLQEPSILERLHDKMAENNIEIIDTLHIDFEVAVDNLNIRVYPSTQKVKVGAVTKGDILTTDGYVENDGYRWRRLIDGGFCAEVNITDSGIYMEPIETPSWKTEAYLRLQEIRDDIQALQTLLDEN